MNQQITGPGALLSSAWGLFKANWKILVPIAILPTVGSYIGQLMAATHQLIPAVVGGIISLIAAIFSIAMGPALVNAIHRLSTEPGVKIEVNPQYKIGFTFFWSVLLIAIINGFVFFGSIVLLIIPAIIVGIYSCVYVYTLVLDGKKGFSALTESYSLVRGRWWPVFGRMLVLGLVGLVIWIIMAGITFVLSLAFGVHAPVIGSAAATAALPIGALAISLIVNLIGLGFLLPIGASYMYGLYTSLKATRQANIETSAFKKWLITFIIVGILGIPLIGILSSIVLVSLGQSRAHNAELKLQEQMQQLQVEMQQASSTLNNKTLPIQPE